MNGFGYSWLDDHLKQAGLPRPALLSREASEDGPSFGYETLNLVDGRRCGRSEIRDELAATVAPAPVEEVAAYLATLEKLGLLERVRHERTDGPLGLHRMARDGELGAPDLRVIDGSFFLPADGRDAARRI